MENPALKPEQWRTSSRSNGGGNCVEIGRVADGAAVRDTKDRSAGYFTVDGPLWRNFLVALKLGRFDA